VFADQKMAVVHGNNQVDDKLRINENKSAAVTQINRAKSTPMVANTVSH
jgi:hypothetical protein